MEQTLIQSEIHFKDYYDLYYKEMYYVAKRIVHNHHSAEDVVQEAYIKAYNNYGHLIDQKKRRPWLRTIVIRTAIDFYRKQTKYDVVSVESGEEVGHILHCPNHSVQKQIALRFEQEELLRKINLLPKSMQDVLKIKLLTDEKDQQIADRLSISLSAVKTRLHRARKLLKSGD